MSHKKLFEICMSVIGTLLVILLNDMRSEMGAMSTSVTDLNNKITVLVTRDSFQSKDIEEIKERLNLLESKK